MLRLPEPLLTSSVCGTVNSTTNKQFVFSIGQYLQLKGNRYGRLDHVIVFDCPPKYRHIFAIVTTLDRTGTRDEVLDLEIFQESENTVIVGITGIDPVKLYMLRVDNVGIVWVDWDPFYM
jgi:hypothetical protein